MGTPQSHPPRPPTGRRPLTGGDRLLADTFAVALGLAFTLCLRGYLFGTSNHTVYLLDALRHNDPALLANDWFATHTLQYHAAFTRLTAWLMRTGRLEAGFFAGYLASALLLHVIWLALARRLGGNRVTYLASVVLFGLSAGGIGLGMYDFLQDSAFLPSNVANVAMLGGIYFLIAGELAAAGLCLGLAGFFHLNHALVAIGLWGALSAWAVLRPVSRTLPPHAAERELLECSFPAALLPALSPGGDSPVRRHRAGFFVGSAVLLVLCLLNVVPAVRVALADQARLPLAQFVDLYVRLRHPHHYDPSSWPVALWVCFLWPVPLAAWAARVAPPTAARRIAARVFLLLAALLVVALLGAGAWYVNESLIQMSLFRFGIYVKLLSCVGAAWLMQTWAGPDRPRGKAFHAALLAAGLAGVAVIPFAWQRVAVRRFLSMNLGPLLFLAALCFLISLSVFAEDWGKRAARAARLLGLALLLPLLAAGWGRWLGLVIMPETLDPPPYLAFCDWVRDHTPEEAVFLVPPQELAFRLRARRAVVVNFKCVPQLSSELPQWRDRLRDVLRLDDLMTLPRRWDRTLAAIAQRYETMPPEEFRAMAREARAKYGAAYVVVAHRVGGVPPESLVFEMGGYHLYDVRHW